MAERTKLLSYRLPADLHAKLTVQAASVGLSPGAFAREVLIERLAGTEVEAKGVKELYSEVKTLRRELAQATWGILTALNNPISAEEATEWVREHLNR